MIVRYNELTALAKKCTAEQSEAERGIREAERFDIIPAIGAPLYVAIETNPTAYADILNEGALYASPGCSGGQSICQGLKTAIAYYAEARICRGNNVQLDRFGANIKTNEYSQNAQYKEIDAEARYLESCGFKALESVLGYISANASDPAFSAYIQAPKDDERNVFESITFLNRD